MPFIVPVPPGWRARFARTSPRDENPPIQGEMWGDTDEFYEKPIGFAQPFPALAEVTWYCVNNDGSLFDPTTRANFIAVCGPMQGIPSGSPDNASADSASSAWTGQMPDAPVGPPI